MTYTNAPIRGDNECCCSQHGYAPHSLKCDKCYAALAAQLAAAERDVDTLLGMIRHQRDVLRECLPYLYESMAGRRPGRSADDIRAAVKALTADAALERQP